MARPVRLDTAVCNGNATGAVTPTAMRLNALFTVILINSNIISEISDA
jgi:hypothetical protein